MYVYVCVCALDRGIMADGAIVLHLLGPVEPREPVKEKRNVFPFARAVS